VGFCALGGRVLLLRYSPSRGVNDSLSITFQSCPRVWAGEEDLSSSCERPDKPDPSQAPMVPRRQCTTPEAPSVKDMKWLREPTQEHGVTR